MMHERAITAAIADSAITRVALLDDAFDPPTLPEDSMGPLLELIESLGPGEIAPAVTITQPEIDDCRNALEKSEYDADAVTDFISKLYDAFVRTGLAKFDPAGEFTKAKKNNLAYVLPLLHLLRKCNPALEVFPVGSRASNLDDAAKAAHLIFVDYYLNANLSTDGEPSADQEAKARESSVARLSELLHGVASEDSPSIILMSSHKVADKLDAFKQELCDKRGHVFASRFAFIEKRQLELQAGVVTVEAETFDALLGVVRSYVFGRTLHTALATWKAGVDKAVNAVWTDINALTIKDYAYLVRFRLAQEGLTLSEYTEWFFNECLADAIGQAVDWESASFVLLDKPTGPVTSIRGAYDGATKAVAHMFDKVRIEKPRATPRRNHRMGDLYLFTRRDGGREIRALVTPDCDLIRRGNGNCKAKSLLFVSGELRAIDAPDASLSDFILIDGVAQNILWQPKEIGSLPVAHFTSPGKPPARFKSIGTLKPLYAYELRAHVLEDLGRFGLNVPPAMGSNATVTVIVHGETEDILIDLASPEKSACSLIFSRGGADATKAVFFESAVAKLVSELAAIQPDKLSGQYRRALLDLSKKLTTQDLVMRKLSGDGAVIDGPRIAGMQVTSKAKAKARNATDRAWCQLVVSNSAIEQTL